MSNTTSWAPQTVHVDSIFRCLRPFVWHALSQMGDTQKSPPLSYPNHPIFLFKYRSLALIVHVQATNQTLHHL